MAAMARVSFKGNLKHNPGEALHWAKHKSTDHADCMMRHLFEAEEMSDSGELHAAHIAWRACAHSEMILLAKELGLTLKEFTAKLVAEAAAEEDFVDLNEIDLDEEDDGPDLDVAAINAKTARSLREKYIDPTYKVEPEVFEPTIHVPKDFDIKDFVFNDAEVEKLRRQQAAMAAWDKLEKSVKKEPLNVIPTSKSGVVKMGEYGGVPIFGVSKLANVSWDQSDLDRHPTRVTYEVIRKSIWYICGPMTGIEKYNFPAFDRAEEYLTKYYDVNVISPATLDREHGVDENKPVEVTEDILEEIIQRDLDAIMTMKASHGDAIALLPGWEASKGACAELMLGRWKNLRMLNALNGLDYVMDTIDWPCVVRNFHSWMEERAAA
jgi:hypothetical protein